MARPVPNPTDQALRDPDRDRELLERAYRKLLRAFFDAVGADLGALVACNGDAGPQLLSMWEREQDSMPWVPESSVLDRAFESDRAIVHPPLAPAAGNGDAAGAVRALAAPVRTSDDVLGAIYAGFSKPPALRLEELSWIAESYAALAALCMTGDYGISQAVGSATRDTLTGCLNFSAVMEVLSGEFARAQRHEHPLSCCFIDLDGFKRVNDTLGHMQGNRVLAAVGEALRLDARGYDTVGRFGGDEFVVVLPETRIRAAQAVAQRLRLRLAAAIAVVTDVPVDVSIGVAQLTDERSAEELLETADRAMGDAKRNGGARVTTGVSTDMFDEPPESPTEIFGGKSWHPRPAESPQATPPGPRVRSRSRSSES
jgi:diguanylate cyclase (GGDEF)-like protein